MCKHIVGYGVFVEFVDNKKAIQHCKVIIRFRSRLLCYMLSRMSPKKASVISCSRCSGVCLPTGQVGDCVYKTQIWHKGFVCEQCCPWFPVAPSVEIGQSVMSRWPCQLLLLSSATACLCMFSCCKTAVNWFKNEFKRSNINQAANNQLEIANTEPAH